MTRHPWLVFRQRRAARRLAELYPDTRGMPLLMVRSPVNGRCLLTTGNPTHDRLLSDALRLPFGPLGVGVKYSGTLTAERVRAELAAARLYN